MTSENPSGGGNQQETACTNRLNAHWVVGFVDGEGCFSVSIHRNPYVRRTRGWQLNPVFQVSQHVAHRAVLEGLMRFFACGKVRTKGPTSKVHVYAVDRTVDLEKHIIPFFESFPLRVKHADFLAFAEIVRSLRAKEHLVPDGFERVVRLAYSMNQAGKQRSRTLEEVLNGSSETTREALSSVVRVKI